MYPILNLCYHGKYLDLYQRSLEEVIIRALHSAFSIKASRVDGLTGVWVGMCYRPEISSPLPCFQSFPFFHLLLFISNGYYN